MVFGQSFGEAVGLPGHDVDDARRDIAGVEHLVEVRGREREGARGHDHGPVAHGERGHQQRHEGEQRRLVGTHEAHDAEGLMHGQRDMA